MSLEIQSEKQIKNLKPFLKVLSGQKADHIPHWFMRQAGRYLPEYWELRVKAGGFLNMVYNPDQASEVTMQPIRRFGMDAAILFSDILVIPHALGQDLRFETGEGPKLQALQTEKDFAQLSLDKIDEVLNPIYGTVSQTRQKLKDENFSSTTLIGFAGSPWTVACYMVEGGGSKTFEKTKKWAYGDPTSFQKLIDILVKATSHYLIKQIEAGAEAIQLFDSWSNILDTQNFDQWVIKSTQAIIKKVRITYPDIPVIGFPRDAGEKTLSYVQGTDIQAVGIDFARDPQWVKQTIQPHCIVQGNLDPVMLLTGGKAMEEAVMKILESWSDHPFIFNLGHGVIKETDPANIEKLCDIIRNFKA